MQKLVNKLMSRDYNTYKYSEEAYKQQPVNSIPVPQDVPADLGVLRDFQDSLI